MPTPPSGIYAIRNTINNKFYVGSSVNFVSRWNVHRNALRRNAHHNPRLQNAWNKYGESAFEFVVIHACTDDIELLDLEQKHLDEWVNHPKCYNIKNVAVGFSTGKDNPNYKDGTCGLSPCIDCGKLKPKNNTRCIDCFNSTDKVLSPDQKQRHKEACQKSNQKFIYNTPIGSFTLKEAAKQCDTTDYTIRRFCSIRKNQVITQDIYRKSPTLQKMHDVSCIGKTYKELGWSREKL